MATTFKTFLNNDITSTRTLLHESIPVTGSIVSGTYGTVATALNDAPNIKNYAHGMFQSVYDYPYLSSSANHIFDLTVGYANQSHLSGTGHGTPGGVVQQAKKINIYNQFAQILAGHDATGGILQLTTGSVTDANGNNSAEGTGSGKLKEAIFINFSRLLAKDEIKKGSFSIQIGTGSFGLSDDGSASPFNHKTNGDTVVTIDDAGAENDYRVNSPAGEYAILSMSAGAASGKENNPCGLIYYQAGIVVLSGSIFTSGSGGMLGTNNLGFAGPVDTFGGEKETNFNAVLSGSSITGSCDYFRHRIKNISFNNTTELNSTIHFCRVNHNDFNYSANPTYLSESKIRVKNNSLDSPVSYITTVGLYSADNELLAVAKLSEPLKKDPTNEMTLRVRLDY